MKQKKQRQLWEWKVPKTHGDQPRLEWWLEQVAAMILLRVGIRSYHRGDMRTHLRVRAAINAAAQAERREDGEPCGAQHQMGVCVELAGHAPERAHKTYDGFWWSP